MAKKVKNKLTIPEGPPFNPTISPLQMDGPPYETETTEGLSEDAMDGMMKARIAYEVMHGNPAAERLVTPRDDYYNFSSGNKGSHFMESMDNYAVPQIQDEDGELILGDYDSYSNEAMRFDSEKDA